MSKITSVVTLPAIPSKFENLEELRSYFVLLNSAVYNYIQDIYREFDGKIDTVNLFCTAVTVSDTGNANTEFSVAHNLGFSTVYYIPNINSTSISGDVTFYKGSSTWTTTTAYLKCSQANMNVTFLVIA